MLLEPIAHWWLDRWKQRVEVRNDVRQKRRKTLFDMGGNEPEFAQEMVKRQSQHLTNAWHCVSDWFPSRKSRAECLAENFWLTPKWNDQILPWIIQRINEGIDGYSRGSSPTESIAQLGRRLSGISELQSLAIALEHEVERDPAACVVSAQEKELIAEINSLIAESNFRVAISPPLAVLGLSIGLAWWPFAFAVVPVALAVYGSAISERKEIIRLCLGRLLNGTGSCIALDQLKVWAKREAHRLVKTGDIC